MKNAQPKKPEPLTLDYAHQPVAWKFIDAIARGLAKEIMALGARGDGKTVAALTAMPAHAKEHHAQGFELPTRWLGVRDSFTNHKLSTIETLKKSLWQGAWKGSDQDHTWFFVAGDPPQVLVRLDLIGVDTQEAKDKLKIE